MDLGGIGPEATPLVHVCPARGADEGHARSQRHQGDGKRNQAVEVGAGCGQGSCDHVPEVLVVDGLPGAEGEGVYEVAVAIGGVGELLPGGQGRSVDDHLIVTGG